MEILSNEVVLSGDYFIGIYVLALLTIIVLSIFILSLIYDNCLFYKIITGIATIGLLFSLVYLLFNNEEEYYTELIVVVNDWNIIYEEDCEVLKVDGKIVTIRKILNHE